MHPQLESKRFNSCYDLIVALDKCHQKEYYKRIFGLCNNEKDALTKCLHDARLAGERDLIKQRREERKAVENKWKKIDEEEYGEDAILKKILERHQAKKSVSSKPADSK
ncbi:Cmc2p TDEL_0C01650 [Torulaspora delbrueckii]|uniref:COX assembly mitochondrial protein n=1 Tax=Torulaspora delbrueckii TaxID=4950 RepID=G8ZRB2_TORDE|nr:hypothetical protein TDEL_0C01650 [Torulaspora delbrueckii]CCE91054.1 hypothetical protein TDEL_0C01650 [Torulaspora delbrueckii]